MPPVTVTDTATISDPAITGASGLAFYPIEGEATTVTVATFTDPGGAESSSDYSATITWGDGHSSAGSIVPSGGLLLVQGSHAYAEESAADHPGSNPYAVSVSIHHESTAPVTVTTTSGCSVSAAGQAQGSDGVGWTILALAGSIALARVLVSSPRARRRRRRGAR